VEKKPKEAKPKPKKDGPPQHEKMGFAKIKTGGGYPQSNWKENEKLL